MSDYGFVPTGPSELYLQMLKGEISPKDYAKRTKKRVEADSGKKPRGTATQRKRA